MEIPWREVDAHRSAVENVLRSICRLPKGVRFTEIRSEGDGVILNLVRSGRIRYHQQRDLITELGVTETVIALALPNPANGRFWIGAHEKWVFTASTRDRTLRFKNCSLRLYAGAEEPAQVLRLEWTARHVDGTYDGDSAGHPHWHVDTAALLRRAANERAQAVLAAPVAERIETFDPTLIARPTADVPTTLEYEWLGRLHLAANAGWMGKKWNGTERPGPHQSEPMSLAMLNRWWEGAIRYIDAEVRRQSRRTDVVLPR